MNKLIEDYEVQLVEPGCTPGADRWGVQVCLPDDISAVFPYLNAVLDKARYDHENRILIWGDMSQKYALRPNEIRVARVQDPLHARQVVSEVVDNINRVWQERESITPNLTERKLPAVLDVFKLLPGTNCKQCGYPTCMAYAAALRQEEAEVEQCLPLSHPENVGSTEKLLSLISVD